MADPVLVSLIRAANKQNVSTDYTGLLYGLLIVGFIFILLQHTKQPQYVAHYQPFYHPNYRNYHQQEIMPGYYGPMN